MYAIVKTGGKQYRVEAGDELNVELLADTEVGGEIIFDQILMVGGEKPVIGTPLVDGASVRATVVHHGRSRKIIVFKHRRRGGYRKKRGHRQCFTRVKITEVTA